MPDTTSTGALESGRQKSLPSKPAKALSLESDRLREVLMAREVRKEEGIIEAGEKADSPLRGNPPHSSREELGSIGHQFWGGGEEGGRF